MFFVRSALDEKRFEEYPDDALAYRGGYERLGEEYCQDKELLRPWSSSSVTSRRWEPGSSTKPHFFDERMGLCHQERLGKKRACLRISHSDTELSAGIYFNSTARLLIETATDVHPLTAYCEHPDCIRDSFYTYRYYLVGGTGVSRPLLRSPYHHRGRSAERRSEGAELLYTRCDEHHFLPGKVYTYFTLKPLGDAAAAEESLRA